MILRGLRRIVTTWPFVLALAVLLANDFWWKRAWPGVVSGKLSDFAGIAVVSLLLLTAFPDRRRLVVGGIVVGFAWWKSPLSQPAIDALDAWLPFTIGRTVDYTDLVAFIVMPACAVVASRPGEFALPGATVRRWLATPVIALTAFALMATSSVDRNQPYSLAREAASAPVRPPEPVVDHDAVEQTVARVVAQYGLQRDPESKTHFMGGGVQCWFKFVGDRSVSLEVDAPPTFPWRTGAGVRATRLRDQLTAQLMSGFPDLVVVEHLGARASRPAASTP